MKKENLFLVIVCFTFFNGFAQHDSLVNHLDQVIIQADYRLKEHSVGYKVTRLNDSILLKNTESFSALMRFNSPLYVKEYGAGGTSSVSFRGTSATNTAVVWNGININAVNNGQTDFNALTVSLFDAIDIRSGGGSLEYGSGAIGGTVHLNDYLQFSEKERITNQFVASVGSFETYNGLYKINVSNAKFALNAGLNYVQSENDYPWNDGDLYNYNGAYQNLAFNVNAAFLLNTYSKLKLYSANYLGERFFSGELPNPFSANDKYNDFSFRNLLIYTHDKGKIYQEAKLAFISDEYRYFENEAVDYYDYGKSKRYIANYNISYQWPQLNASISSYSEYESTFGNTNKILEKNRKQFSQSFIFEQKIGSIFDYNAKVRKDFNSDYEVPFTYALGMKLHLNNGFFFRANGSKNYRVPTYNDLYWPGQGNLDLIPETAWQADVGIGFKNNLFNVDIGAFYIDASDKIVWTPNGDLNKPNVWVPINLDDVDNKGVELVLSYNNCFNKHHIHVDVNYSYTESINQETGKQVIFVPKHLLKGSLGYTYGRFSLYYQQLVTGKVYTTESNSEDFIVPQHAVANVGLDFRLFNTKNNQCTLGVKVNNVFDEYYVVQPRRPMPNRNFNFNINYKF
ncbi:TonB-dependent receptor [Tamlana haliotis]|uniref:TonB-dependent receptor n=1 Tax=Pseudotamlana haliotis TaxID=2614804 RepID=A0A6N6MF15_9FLAO|nr:TonB-dependent receptor [Tamlana haliotis]KAB1069378.1 TonB-dependent receptor [Tamlana haliotis]